MVPAFIRETTENVSANLGYKFGFGQYVPRSLHFFWFKVQDASGVITVRISIRISRRWTCQLRWAKLALHTCCGLTPCRVEDEEQDHLWVGAIIPWRLCTESEWNASECFRDAQSQEAAMWAKDFGWVPILASPSCLWPILWFMVPPTLLRRRLSTRGALAASYNSHGGLGGISIQHPSELGRIIRTGEHICGSVASTRTNVPEVRRSRIHSGQGMRSDLQDWR